MAGKVQVIRAAPTRRVDTATGSFSMVGAPGGGPPMGPPAQHLATSLAAVSGVIELPAGERDDAWAREIARRESDAAAGWAAEGIKPPVPSPPEPPTRVSGGMQATPVAASFAPVFRDAPADLSGLPDHFTLEVGQKPDGWWIVTAPAHHVGLFVANQDLLVALNDAPGALAQILRLDGARPQAVKRRRK